MRYMGFDEEGRVVGNSDQPTDGYVQVSDEVFALHQAHPEYIWNGEALVPWDTKFPPITYVPSAEELKQIIVNTVQSHMDAVAQARRYDNIFTLGSYHDSVDATFSAEAQAGKLWQTQIWQYLRQLEEDVEAGRRTFPDIPTLYDELPAIPEILRTGEYSWWRDRFLKFFGINS